VDVGEHCEAEDDAVCLMRMLMRLRLRLWLRRGSMREMRGARDAVRVQSCDAMREVAKTCEGFAGRCCSL